MQAEKPVQQAFGSSGGKFHLAKKIASMMPEHTTYVEPYAGGAAVYFYKEPAEKAVLNDMDKEIAFAYRFIRDMTPAQYDALKKKGWVISRGQFARVKKMVPQNDVDRFYKFYYLKRSGFRCKGTVNVGNIGKVIKLDRLLKVQNRLCGVAVNSGDAMKMIDKHDSANTLFYLDPPYPQTTSVYGNAPDFSREDLTKLIDRLKRIRGKFILSMDTKNARTFPKWMNIRRVVTKHLNGENEHGIRVEVVATNYKLARARRRRNGKRHYQRSASSVN